MDARKIEKIFQHHGLGEVRRIVKSAVGFTNHVYIVNDIFVLKVCEDTKNEERFTREVFLYGLFRGKIPVPDIQIFDDTKTLSDKLYMLYPKIDGVNVYSRWHLLNMEERRRIVQELCGHLRSISETPYETFAKRFSISLPVNWHDTILQRIRGSLRKVQENKLLAADFIRAIREFINTHHPVLEEQKIALVHWDTHFDNILINENSIVGLLDFERTDLSSIDYALDVIHRMVDYPKKYMSEEFEHLAKKEHYEKLLVWFRNYYPELFRFENLEERLALYAIEHDLDTLLYWPRSQEVRDMLARTIAYNSSKLA